jgi:DNA-binding NtrC family response regulator
MGTNDDVSTPAIVIAHGVASPLLLPANADLGRVIEAAGATHEIADERMSRDHATVRWAQGTWTIRDLDSRNGTYVNGERIHGEVKRRGDVVVRLGHTIFVLVADGQGHPGFADRGAVVGPELARVYDQIQQLARQGAGVLMVQGGAGSGKQCAARVYHAASPRAGGPFNVVSCQGLQGVADRLIFGGRKGVVESIGQLQMARGGTLYLAGIAELDPAAQASLVKLLERKAGTIDTNIVCAGSELRTAVADAKVREDLAAALAPFSVALPPLRSRRVDLIRIVQLEAAEVGQTHGATLELHPRLIEACAIRPWPGNVRELRAAIAFAASRALADQRTVLRPEDLLDTAGLPPGASSAETSVERKSGGSITHTPTSLAETLRRANGSLAVAARMLNLHRTQLAKLLEDAAIPYAGLAHDD